MSEKHQARSEDIDLMGLQIFSRTFIEIAERYASEAESIIRRTPNLQGFQAMK